MTNYMGTVFKLINSCNTQVANNNDYNIARTVLSYVNDLEVVSLEELANQANISQASVSRFIKKMGFKSYQDFRESFQKAFLEIKLNRKLANVTQYPHRSVEKMADQVHQEAIDNLMKTREIVPTHLLLYIIKIMKEASSVSFYGDDHALSIFYTLQLDLLANGTPAYLFKITDVQGLHMQFIDQHSVVMFFNVYSGFFSIEQKEILEVAKKNGAKIIVFTQDELESDALFDLIVYYGQSKSLNTGYYSLLYISRILSELFYYET